MKSRTIVEKMPDGHIVVTKQVRSGDGGTARDRRALRKLRNLGEEPLQWHKAERKIFRNTVPTEYQFGEGVMMLPFCSQEMSAIANDNQIAAAAAGSFAEMTAAEIDASNAAFEKDAPRRRIPKLRKIVLCFGDGTVEEL